MWMGTVALGRGFWLGLAKLGVVGGLCSKKRELLYVDCEWLYVGCFVNVVYYCGGSWLFCVSLLD